MGSKVAKTVASATACVAALLVALWAAPNAAQQTRQLSVSLRDTFPVGSNGLCQAQIAAPEPDGGLFDRRYSIVCRDAAAPIGTLWAVRDVPGDQAVARFGGIGAECRKAESAAGLEHLRGAQRYTCQAAGSVIRTQMLVGEIGNTTYAALGLSAYEKALQLGIDSLASDRLVPGTVDIPLTQTTDALAFARQQAEAIAADQALVEAYRRGNNGQFAEAAEYFAASAAALSGKGAIEARLNAAVQQSNLGNYGEAERPFVETRAESVNDPVLARLQRNYEAIDALNRKQPDIALDVIRTPLPNEFGDIAALRNLRIDEAMANRLAVENERVVGSAYALSLTRLERAQLLDGQADYLGAIALRLLRRSSGVEAQLRKANSSLAEVRSGRVISIVWLRAQVLGELAEAAERDSRGVEAERLHFEGIGLLEAVHPGSPALHSARATGGILRAGGTARRGVGSVSNDRGRGRGAPIANTAQLAVALFWSAARRAGSVASGERYVRGQSAAATPRSCSNAGGAGARIVGRQ